MNTSRLLIATACSLAVTGAASVAFAQTITTPTTPTAPSSTTPNPYPNQIQGSGQTQVQTPTTITVPGSTTPGSINSTTQRPVEITTPMGGTTGTAGTTGTTGTAATRATDGDTRTPADRMSGERATVRTERTPRADRN